MILKPEIMRKMLRKIKITCMIVILFSVLFISCIKQEQNSRESRLFSGYTDDERNRLLAEDINHFALYLPKIHENPFEMITSQEFKERTAALSANVANLTDEQVIVELAKIIALIGDAHTGISYWDGSIYPVGFWMFGGKVYVTGADKGLEDMLYSEVMKINGRDINEIIELFTQIIPHENENWLAAMLPKYLSIPVYLYALDIVPNGKQAVFTVITDDGEKEFFVDAYKCAADSAYYVEGMGKLTGNYETYYDYEYLSEYNAIYLEYNACKEMQDLNFTEFNEGLFDTIENNKIKKIIVDLRCNTGGNPQILNPFTEKLRQYMDKNGEAEVYILIGRQTFSAGLHAVYKIKEAVPAALTVGEPSGMNIDHYGEVMRFELPNSKLLVQVSTKYCEYSKIFSYTNAGTSGFVPDVFLQPDIGDYRNRCDIVLDYVLFRTVKVIE